MHKLFLAFCQKFTLKSTSRDVILPINNAALLIVDGDCHKPVPQKADDAFSTFWASSFPCGRIISVLCTRRRHFADRAADK